jgi:hypothetical protein
MTFFANVVNRHRHEPSPAARIHLAAIDVINLLREAQCPEDFVFDIAAAPSLADENTDVDREVDEAQIQRAGFVHTPFTWVRREMHHLLVQQALDELVEAGHVERVLIDDGDDTTIH